MNIKKILLVILLVILIAAAANYKKINNLYTVVTLFDENKIVYNFSHLHESMFSTELMSGVASVAFPEDKKQIVKKYIWKNKTKSIEDYLTATNSTSLLVLHDGKLVHENYRLGTTQTDTRISWSMAKSFLSALFGIAVENGQIDITKTVTDYVPELADSAYNQVPIVAVLNMASGVEFNEDYLDFNSDINKMGRALGLGSSMDEFAGTLKTQERKPGTNRHYDETNVMVGGLIGRAGQYVSAVGSRSHRFTTRHTGLSIGLAPLIDSERVRLYQIHLNAGSAEDHVPAVGGLHDGAPFIVARAAECPAPLLIPERIGLDKVVVPAAGAERHGVPDEYIPAVGSSVHAVGLLVVAAAVCLVPLLVPQGIRFYQAIVIQP